MFAIRPLLDYLQLGNDIWVACRNANACISPEPIGTSSLGRFHSNDKAILLNLRCTLCTSFQWCEM